MTKVTITYEPPYSDEQKPLKVEGDMPLSDAVELALDAVPTGAKVIDIEGER